MKMEFFTVGRRDQTGLCLCHHKKLVLPNVSRICQRMRKVRKRSAYRETKKMGVGSRVLRMIAESILPRKDIGEVQLAKAAIAAGIQLLLKKRSIEESQIQTVYLAGGFGNYMSAENAARIGLIPESFVKKVQCVGNIAGEGAKIALLNKNERHEIENAVRNMEFLELAACPEFQDCFVDELGFER